MKFYSVKMIEKEIADPAALAPLTEKEGVVEGEAEQSVGAIPVFSERQIESKVTRFNTANGKKTGVAMPTAITCDQYVAALRENDADPAEFLAPLIEYFTKRDRSSYELLCTEIDADAFVNELRGAEGVDLCPSVAGTMRLLDLGFFFRCLRDSDCSDRVVESNDVKEDLYRKVEEDHLGAEFERELDRIYAKGKVEKFIGHPAHYIVAANSHPYRKAIVQGLISALYETGRLSSKRYTICDMEGDLSANAFNALYEINRGATILLRAANGARFLRETEHGEREPVEGLLEVVRRHAAETLTIFGFDSLSEKETAALRQKLGHFAMVEFTPDLFCGEEAVRYAEKLAAKDGISIDGDFRARLATTESGFVAERLDEAYAEWKSHYISTEVFPEYGAFFVKQSEEKKAERTGMDELNDLIGLASVKQKIKATLDYFKLRQEYGRRGIEFRRPNMHMVFSGNPGTAKTTVARLVARIYKENGLLSVGDLVEVGRKDLVGKYVGHTAKQVEAIFEKAKGSVLFIDEAYSLVDDRKGLYGDEAINTIVQLMENMREDLVVIFAGYSREMDEFLERNPGLRSRIATHVSFDDYDENALCDITELLSKKDGTLLAPESRETLRAIYKEARRDSTFGNGRYARSLYEKAKMHLAGRVADRDLSTLTDEELITLLPEDFTASVDKGASTRVRFGFGE